MRQWIYFVKTTEAGNAAVVEALTRSMAVEYAPDRIRVNAIAPGVTPTARVQEMLAGESGSGHLAEGHLLGFDRQEHIAQMAAYLASDGSQVVTGQVFRVDSGVSIH